MHPLIEKIERGVSLPRTGDWIAALGGELELLPRLEETPQDPEWHGEGDVRAHTDLVLDELEAMLKPPDGAASHLDRQRRVALALAGLFHDVGKALTTSQQERDGRLRWVSPRHPARGRSWLAMHHHVLGLERPVVEGLLAAVGHHHDPARLLREGAPVGWFRKLARMADLELLYLLECADLRGRICADREARLEDLELFQLLAREQGLWNPVRHPWADWEDFIGIALADTSPAFRRLAIARGIRDAEAGRISTPEEAVARSYVWRDRPTGELVLLCGVSGSGKTTWAKRHLPEHETVSLDQWRERLARNRADHRKEGEVLQAARKELRQRLREGRRVVWDATNLRRDFRAPLLQLGMRYGALSRVLCFSIPFSEALRRNRMRPHPVAERVLARQFERMEWPFPSEAHEVEWPGDAEPGGKLA